MPTTRACGAGRRSVRNPTTGCSTEAVSISASVISPTWVKLKSKLAFSTG